MILNEIIGTVMQIGLFTLIPFVFYLISTKSAKGFSTYIGLTIPTKRSVNLAIASSLIILLTGIGLTLVSDELKEVMFASESITGKIRALGFGVESITILLIIALLKTSFSEEILFRGFIAKRFINKMGFIKGNLTQAAIFGLIHLVLFLGIMQAQLLFLIYIFLLTGVAAYVIGYINEQVGKGSIIPGWIAHGLGNTLSYTIVAFLM